MQMRLPRSPRHIGERGGRVRTLPGSPRDLTVTDPRRANRRAGLLFVDIMARRCAPAATTSCVHTQARATTSETVWFAGIRPELAATLRPAHVLRSRDP